MSTRAVQRLMFNFVLFCTDITVSHESIHYDNDLTCLVQRSIVRMITVRYKILVDEIKNTNISKIHDEEAKLTILTCM